MATDGTVQDVLRQSAPQVLGSLVRRYEDFDACEDAVQEALLAASTQWPGQGIPENPSGWLYTVAARRLVDQLRSDAARRRREATVTALLPPDHHFEPGPDAENHQPDQDDTLTVLFLCCHPALSPSAQAALTLRAVGGLTTEQIASAFLTSESTMARRITRAKQRIKASGVPFRLPPDSELPGRLQVVLQVCYLIFNEGHTTTSGPELARADLAGEAIWLTREVHRLRPADGEVTGLLALLLLTDARRLARTHSDGTLVPLDRQDRTLWERAKIDEGIELLTGTLTGGPAGPYQLQAAIAAVHAEAEHARDTDWTQILDLYDLLHLAAPSPVVALNRIVAVAMVHGPLSALDQLDDLAGDDRLIGYHRLPATRAHLLEMAGEHRAARADYRLAANLATSPTERRYLEDRAERLVADSSH
ncbi:MAG TPA: sigma-70 family RNA polymerase sigma factor [Pseudonocardiaceae bacterium]|jgi:RNA polymerase sigma factor (sigma-70 family)